MQPVDAESGAALPVHREGPLLPPTTALHHSCQAAASASSAHVSLIAVNMSLPEASCACACVCPKRTSHLCTRSCFGTYRQHDDITPVIRSAPTLLTCDDRECKRQEADMEWQEPSCCLAPSVAFACSTNNNAAPAFAGGQELYCVYSRHMQYL